MHVPARTRSVFRQQAQNDNVPVARRRLAGVATLLAILGTSAALVLVHSVAAWLQPGWRSAASLIGPAAAGGGRPHPRRHFAVAQVPPAAQPTR
jgi:hypothetical protein